MPGLSGAPPAPRVNRRRAPRTRAHAPPSTPHCIASHDGVESPVARGRAGSAVTCSQQCICNFGACCATAMACVALPRVANQRGGADAAAQSEVHPCFRLRPRLARRYVHVHSVWRSRGARRARGTCGTAVSGVARRWAASRWRRCGRAGRGASLLQQRPRMARKYVHWHTRVNP